MARITEAAWASLPFEARSLAARLSSGKGACIDRYADTGNCYVVTDDGARRVSTRDVATLIDHGALMRRNTGGSLDAYVGEYALTLELRDNPPEWFRLAVTQLQLVVTFNG